MEEKEITMLRTKLISTARTLLTQLHDIIPEEPLGSFKGGDGLESEGMIVNHTQNVIDVSRKEGNVEIITECLRSLEKIDEGSYGECDECEKPIATGRLKLSPYSNLCTQCKSDQEKANKHLCIVSDQGPHSCVSIKTIRQRLYSCIAHA
ncbi:MAG: Transcriptional regulator, TraR/DksA family [Candidatus Moranbacteria bacterium GW2011_GWC2_37_73]|nr:MAG: Transcriptional regulator, TraR/DksA family [Parcubacteria group bacterium GW2011_GWC1_36_108]KKQ39713.1 MAG: Transcriptional regulator, TraR/DksA family [Candidatus Moranbacteria bacterium GW2011_GWC2_37_73]HBU10368.1 hypothetical protein [Candidatus Moranbacteria bacterium]HCO99542.1 hypothetical protein [Candidatus Moranbacteria bacterium]